MIMLKLMIFAKAIITSMNGYLEYLYTLKYKDKYYIYDFGDNWVFKISVAKVIPGHNNKNIELIDGIRDDFDINRINDELDKKYNMRK